MAYTPKAGGYKWRQSVTRGRKAVRVQRQLIQRIVEGGLGQAELYQTLTAVALMASQIDEVLEGLLVGFEDADTERDE